MKKFLKYGNIILWAVIAVMGAYILCKGVLTAASDNRRTNFFSQMNYNLNQKVMEWYMPGLMYPVNAEEKERSFTEYIVEKALGIIPIGGYVHAYGEYETEVESMSTYEMIIASEANDENHIDEDGQLVASEEDIQNMEEENAQVSSPAVVDEAVSIDQLRDYDFLIRNYYTVDSTTTIGSDQLNADELLSKNMTMQNDNSNPQILIYHTHSQEAFADSEAGNESHTIVGAGDYLTQILTEEYGYNVMHHKGVYDMVGGKLDRNQAYTLAETEIERLLEENPSIEVVIDLHRDGVREDTHLVTEVNGKQTAQFMFFNGLSRTTANGDIAYLANEYIQDNLAFSLQMQLKANQYYPGVARKIYLKGYRYNMHLRPKTLLIECGAQTNTVEEIYNAMEPIADVLHKVLAGE